MNQNNLKDLLTPWSIYLHQCMVEWKQSKKIKTNYLQPASLNMCRAASWATQEFLCDNTDQGWMIVGGWHNLPLDKKYHPYVNQDQLPGGMIDQWGRYNGHYWVSSEQPVNINDIDQPISNFKFMYVDITADQFGYSKLLVTDENDQRYRANLYEDLILQEIEQSSIALGAKWYREYEKYSDTLNRNLDSTEVSQLIV